MGPVTPNVALRGSPDGDSLKVDLLTDIRKAFVARDTDRLSTEQLLDFLTAEKERPWCEIKRVPIVSDGRLVGIVSRANLVQALASSGNKLEIPRSDTAIRDQLLAHLHAQHWAHTGLLNVTVNDGVVDLWGLTNSEIERKAIRVAAEAMAGVRAVNDHLRVRRPVSE